LFLGGPEGQGNERNGYTTRTFAVKGVGAVEVRVPRDREGLFTSNLVPARPGHHDEAPEKDGCRRLQRNST
jgi:transposase-like protein